MSNYGCLTVLAVKDESCITSVGLTTPKHKHMYSPFLGLGTLGSGWQRQKLTNDSVLPSRVCKGLSAWWSSWSRASALLFRLSRKGGDSSGVSGASDSRALGEGCNCGAIEMTVDTLRELTPPSLVIPWELVLKWSSLSADGIVLSHSCLVKTICGWEWEGSMVDDVDADGVGNLGSDRGTRMTDIAKGTGSGMHSFVVKMFVFDAPQCQYGRQRSKDGGARGHYSTTPAPVFLSLRQSRRLVLRFSLYHYQRRHGSCRIVLIRCGLTGGL